MRCRKAKKMLSPWLDGALAAAPESGFLRHLDRCPSCAREARQLKAITGALRAHWAEAEPPPWLAAGVMARLEEAPARPVYALRLKALSLAVSVLLVFGLHSLVARDYLARWPVAPAAAPRDGLALPEDPAELPVVDNYVPADLAPEAAEPEVTKAAPVVAAPVERQRGPVPAPAPEVTAAAPAPEAAVAVPAVEAAPVLVASLDTVVIPGPEVFLPQKRVAEGVTLRVAVPSMAAAAAQLEEVAASYGLAPAMEYTVLAHDGRLVRIYRYDVPFMLANQFVAGTTSLGRLLSEQRAASDISGEYNSKLEQYLQLAAQAGSGEEGSAGTAALLLGDLARMHQAAQAMKSFTIWLES